MIPRRLRSGFGRLVVAAMLCVAVAGGSRVLAAPGESDATAPIEAGTLDGTDLDVRQGDRAVHHLEATGTLDDVASGAGLAPQELREELLDDPSMFVTGAGFVGYADTLESTSPSVPVPLTAGALPADVFALDSRPTSSRVIYLDFDGHTATDPAWASAGYSGTIVSAPFDLDGTAGFSVAERAVIHEVWQRVSEDYRPFDVNVTTRDPGVEGLRRSPPADAAYGQRMVITPSNFASSTVIGLALLDVFDAGADHAGYVFTDLAGGGYKQSAKTIGEAVSHEAGHTLGLSHDGGPANPNYYDGHGSWAPIMGRPINPSTPVTQWSKGEYTGATNREDDLAVIASLTGYRPDDHGDVPAGATVVAANSITVGTIGRTGDRDVFAVDVLDGTLSVQLRPLAGEASWSNLAAKMTIRDASGGVIVSVGPSVPSGWTDDAAVSVAEGRYTVEVQPVGWLTPSTGFSTYGSLGAYQLVVSAPQGAPPLTAGASGFSPVTPTRLVDTRNGIGASARVGAGGQVLIQVAGRATVPAGATAAVLSVAAVRPTAPGFVTVYPCSDTVPDTSTLNYVAGQTVANTTIAALSGAGQVCVWTSSDTDILVDIAGWIGPGGSSRLTPIGPTRVVDTRAGLGGARLAAGGTMTVDLNGAVPAGSTAVALNVTGVDASAPGYITVFPCAGAVPNTSTINYVTGEARPNNSIVGLSDGRVCIFSDASTDVLVDLVGSFGSTGLGYRPTSPVRVLDTRRTDAVGAGGVVGYGVGSVSLGGQVPGAAFVNVTAANHAAPGYVTTYDCTTRRDTSTLNQKVGQAVANGAIVPVTALQSCLWTYGGGDLIVDLNGWWVP